MSEDAEPFQAEALNLEARQDPSGTTIVLGGDFDMAGAEPFWAFLTEALAEAPRAVTVDAASLEFIDSSGLAALLRAREVATAAGVEFRIRNPSPALRRIVEVTGLKDLLPVD